MGKNRTLTEEEREIHRKATSLRKMTDKQLVERLERISDSDKLPPILKGNGGEEAIAEREKANSVSPVISEFLEKFESANVAGIGKVTIKKLYDFARENNYI